ncbi:MAG: ImmA/IrrE family metallo-endopeptidase [Candidatus Pacebacteria bacterium]|nr:ImmA/IrrE family metallo-endopeptidase [Candidatus Paceibacterota bacterium]
MDYKKVKIPFLDNSAIQEKAENFRLKYWNDSIPVDIEKVIDIKLKIDIVPLHNLQDYCDTDALITSSWDSIYVDYKKFLDERYQNRLRFSFAHEIGHFVLHRDIYNSFEITDKNDFYTLIKEIPELQYGYLEKQANMFANNLLIPRKKLIEESKKIKNNPEIKQALLTIKDEQSLNSYLSIPLSKIFMVSEDAIEIALKTSD